MHRCCCFDFSRIYASVRQVVHWLFVYLDISIQNTVPTVCSLHSDVALHSVDCHTTKINKTNWYFFMMVPQHSLLSSPRFGKWLHFLLSLSLGRSYFLNILTISYSQSELVIHAGVWGESHDVVVSPRRCHEVVSRRS